MPRYFIRVGYKGTNYAGFQIQANANSVQAEVQKALAILFKNNFELTCSSRTDAGVHALCNYFHFDTPGFCLPTDFDKCIYNLNAILPSDIVIKAITLMPDDSHCRFDALSREYQYNIYRTKDPFLLDKAFFYPYGLDLQKLNEAAALFANYTDFTSFSKRNTQVKTFNCQVFESKWTIENNLLIFNVRANRFLRGMVRGMVGTMLRVGTGRINIQQFREIIESKDCSKVDFSVPAHGLFLVKVNFPANVTML